MKKQYWGLYGFRFFLIHFTIKQFDRMLLWEFYLSNSDTWMDFRWFFQETEQKLPAGCVDQTVTAAVHASVWHHIRAMYEDIVNAFVRELLQHVFGEEKMEIKTPPQSQWTSYWYFWYFFIDWWHLANESMCCGAEACYEKPGGKSIN